MAIFFQHVGEQGGHRDFPKTIGTPKSGLVYFQLENVNEIITGLKADEIKTIKTQIQKEAPNGFQLWGIPSGARSVIKTLRKGDWLLLLESDGPGGSIYYVGRVIYKPERELFDLSRKLWGEARFPLIVLLDGKLTNFSWDHFRTSFGYKPNWRLSGMTYRLTPERIGRSQFPAENDVIESLIGKINSAEVADNTFTDLLDQVELLYTSIEGRKLIREHIIRERDPALVRAFKLRLRTYECSICHFDFENVYGNI